MNKIRCDFCDLDLTDSGKTPKYRLFLEQQKMQQNGISFAIIPRKIIKHNCHFCDLICLRSWLISELCD